MAKLITKQDYDVIIVPTPFSNKSVTLSKDVIIALP